MKNSLKQRILKSNKAFAFFHTHFVTEKTVRYSIENNKNIGLDISIDNNRKPYLGQTENYYKINDIERPKTMDFEAVLSLLTKSNIPVIVDCKHNGAWNIVEKVIEKLGAHRCLVHSFATEFKYDYDLYNNDYPLEWSPISKL